MPPIRRRRPQKPKRPYMQFSKKVVVAVTAAVTAISVLAIGFCWNAGDTASLVEVVKSYVGYATIAFAAYSGNSAVEKWLIHQAASDDDDTAVSG